MSLSKFEKNIKSQFGEDGVIEEIFKRINPSKKICVEFGAWDGEHFSNTWNLWINHGWHGILIEGNKEKFGLLKKKYGKRKDLKLCLINEYVRNDGKKNLDNILSKISDLNEIDLLSIDIDGNDYYVFQSIDKFTPKCVIIEYNPTIPAHLEIIQKEDQYFGASAGSIIKLADQKGYILIHATTTNLIFIQKKYKIKFPIKYSNPIDIVPSNHITYIVTSYSGDTYIYGNLTYAKLKSFSIKNFINSQLKKKNSKSVVNSIKLKYVNIFSD